MPDSRRTPPRGSRPRGRTGPGRATSTARAGRQPAVAPRPGAGAGTARGDGQRRPRLTGRAAILVLVVAVLAVSYASSMRAFLEQRAENNAYLEEIAQRSASIDDLEREKRRWNDPAYLQAQARERLSYVMPGETSYIVLDEDGNALESESELRDPSEVDADRVPEAWWGKAWDSVQLAGRPPKAEPPPLTEIDGSQQP
ncbi:septum formation initiator family protein [Nocardioides psychrotolerans]|uniref:FtsB family cell division protein n=1 Tax=Nocardioides psychrotolerans TaxID=1005945 RepID=UPI0031379834